MKQPSTVLTVCRTCRPEGADPNDVPPGEELGRRAAAALRDARPDRVEIRAIACLSACKQACAATVAAPGKFSYVVAGLTPDDAEALVAFAGLHAEAPDGVPPWRERPGKVRKNTISRVPPPDMPHPLVEEILRGEEEAAS